MKTVRTADRVPYFGLDVVFSGDSDFALAEFFLGTLNCTLPRKLAFDWRLVASLFFSLALLLAFSTIRNHSLSASYNLRLGITPTRLALPWNDVAMLISEALMFLSFICKNTT